MTDLDPRSALATAGGLGLAAATTMFGALRRVTEPLHRNGADKPLHPAGAVLEGRLHRFGAQPALGVPHFDAPGDDAVLVRISRAIGLPGAVPDIHGLALRIPVGEGYADLLFASTGLGRAGRFVLTASRSPEGRPMTTLLPYRTNRGPVVLAAVPCGPDRFDVLSAIRTGPWRQLARLEVSSATGEDALVSFDPLLNTLPGLDNYGWVRRLREPAYAAARLLR